MGRLTPALAMKYGYGSVEEYIQGGAQKKFSLLEAGILDGPSTRLLLINVSQLQSPSPNPGEFRLCLYPSIAMPPDGSTDSAGHDGRPHAHRGLDTPPRAREPQGGAVLPGGAAHGVPDGERGGVSLDGGRHGEREVGGGQYKPRRRTSCERRLVSTS